MPMIGIQSYESHYSSLHECLLARYFEYRTLYQSKRRLKVRFSLRSTYSGLPLESASLALAVEFCARELLAKRFDACQLTEFELSLHSTLDDQDFILTAELGAVDDIFAAIQCEIHSPGRATRRPLASAFGTVKGLPIQQASSHLSEVSKEPSNG